MSYPWDDINERYCFDCVGGCGNKTNGSQYCCKTYCINDIDNSSSSEDEEEKTPLNDDHLFKVPEKPIWKKKKKVSFSKIYPEEIINKNNKVNSDINNEINNENTINKTNETNTNTNTNTNKNTQLTPDRNNYKNKESRKRKRNIFD